MTDTTEPQRVSFVRQYDRLFLVTFGLVNLIRGLGGLAAFGVALLGPESAAGDAGGAGIVGALALLHPVVLLLSGIGLLLRRPFGWKLSVAFHANELGKLGGAVIVTTMLGASSAAIQMGTELLVQMAWALFNLLVFLLDPIARLCRIDGRVIGAAAPWITVGVLLAMAKLASVLW
jgi:hypothetical protein